MNVTGWRVKTARWARLEERVEIEADWGWPRGWDRGEDDLSLAVSVGRTEVFHHV